MFVRFFDNLRSAKLPVSLREYLSLLEAMDRQVVMYDVVGFYYLARTALVKDERHLDRFDQVFGHTFKGMEAISLGDTLEAMDLPEEWLRKLAET
ncbi:MAG: VWA domain-containing protein, partial [Pseudomonadota bacterium]